MYDSTADSSHSPSIASISKRAEELQSKLHFQSTSIKKQFFRILFIHIKKWLQRKMNLAP
jgi:hypothetical protein